MKTCFFIETKQMETKNNISGDAKNISDSAEAQAISLAL